MQFIIYFTFIFGAGVKATSAACRIFWETGNHCTASRDVVAMDVYWKLSPE